MDELISHLLAGQRLRATGFIVTVYGDVAEPRGGRLWMATLIEICRLVGISETLVRTAVSRLVAAGRLEGEREGRRSCYRLTEAARAEFAEAAARIFAHSRAPGRWLIAAAAGNDETLPSSGFQPLGGGLWLGVAQPGAAIPADFTMQVEVATGGEAFRAFAAERWRLVEHAAAYAAFCERFKPLAAALQAGSALHGEGSLVARLLLVHHFRVAVLGDPHLPADALGSDWPGRQARTLFSELYRHLSPAADRFIGQGFHAADLPRETQATQRRMLALAGA
ncbi:MAG: PaaX family transcriptional regulator C-terminal domain-containing protein [Geminicoccaceae bacterium]